MWLRFSFDITFLEKSSCLNKWQPLNKLSINFLISGGLVSSKHSLIFNSSSPDIDPIAWIAPFYIAYESIGIPEISIDLNYLPFIYIS